MNDFALFRYSGLPSILEQSHAGSLKTEGAKYLNDV